MVRVAKHCGGAAAYDLGMARPAGSKQEASAGVDAAFDAVPRAAFLPARERRRAGADRPIHIGHGQTNSQPTTVRNMLVLLDVQPGDRVLDVGSGSGWTTALLANLAARSGRVYGVELVPDLVEFGSGNLAAFVAGSGFAVAGSDGRRCADGLAPASIQLSSSGELGLREQAPYDRILVSAESRKLPPALVEQLAPGGRMVAPVAGRLSVVDRSSSGMVTQRRVGHYAFVPLR